MDLREATAPLIGRLTDYEKEYGINLYTMYQLKEEEELHPYRFEGSEYLEAAGIGVRSFGNAPRLENCLRISMGTREENDAWFQAIKAFAEGRG